MLANPTSTFAQHLYHYERLPTAPAKLIAPTFHLAQVLGLFRGYHLTDEFSC
ncbi:MAG: hypothetical protein LDL41_19565 [Coleofasciculus sp. S288]|nr:hypothetical protein [Coleofasciculus sp. S288]